MRRSRWIPRATLIAVAMTVLMVTATTAQATVSVTVEGSKLGVYGSAGTDRPLVRYQNAADEFSPGYSTINDYYGVVDPIPAECVRISPDEVWCEDGGSASLLTDLEMDLGDGFDEPRIEVCYYVMDVAMGEGGSTLEIPRCDEETAFNFTGGSDSDLLRSAIGSTAVVSLDLGDGGDTWSGDPRAATTGTVRGGGGNDTLDSGGGGEQLFGEGGDDDLLGGGGNDVLDGGEGNDDLLLAQGTNNDADPGADDYRGGPGADTLYLDNHPAGMSISLNEAADDGSPGEGDNVHNDIELIKGTLHDDVFTGSPAVDVFEGLDGNDTINGGDGDDDLDAGYGNDRVLGDGGNDQLRGGDDHDTVDGGPGADALYGDRIGCAYICPSGNDTILARDGVRDTVDCGVGADTAEVDGLDIVTQDDLGICEVVNRQDVGGPPPPPNLPTALDLTGSRLALVGRPTVRRGVRAKVSCPTACTFTVTVRLAARVARRYRLGRRALAVGTVRGTLSAAGSKTVRVRLTANSKRRLRRARTVRATLRAGIRNTSGASAARKRAIALRR